MQSIEGVRVLDWDVNGLLPPREWWGGGALRQWNLSASEPGVLRGMHLHGRCEEVYLLLDGAMEVGVCDLRATSPTVGRAASFVIAGGGRAVTVPAGVLHGLYFPQASLLLTGRSVEHDGAEEWRCRWDDPSLALVWSVKRALLSAEDAAAGSLAQLRAAADAALRRLGAA